MSVVCCLVSLQGIFRKGSGWDILGFVVWVDWVYIFSSPDKMVVLYSVIPSVSSQWVMSSCPHAIRWYLFLAMGGLRYCMQEMRSASVHVAGTERGGGHLWCICTVSILFFAGTIRNWCTRSGLRHKNFVRALQIMRRWKFRLFSLCFINDEFKATEF